jgi:hypothetical protein
MSRTMKIVFAHSRDRLKGCYNFHEHDKKGDIVNCPASYTYDGSFHASFLRVCVDQSKKSEESVDQHDTGEGVELEGQEFET